MDQTLITASAPKLASSCSPNHARKITTGSPNHARKTTTGSVSLTQPIKNQCGAGSARWESAQEMPGGRVQSRAACAEEPRLGIWRSGQARNFAFVRIRNRGQLALELQIPEAQRAVVARRRDRLCSGVGTEGRCQQRSASHPRPWTITGRKREASYCCALSSHCCALSSHHCNA